jgi:single-strand DNA-binding protein
MNCVQLLGRLCDNPELRHTPNGVAVATFTLAVNRKMSKDKTDFIDIVVWRGTAEFCEKYFKKGQQVAVSGSIQVRSWKDKDGNNRKTTEVVADEVYFADSKKDSLDNSTQANSDFEEVEEDGELPF